MRDAGWLDVLHALQQNEEAAENLKSWFPPDSGLLQRIQDMHAAYPNGFSVLKEEVHDEAFSKKNSRRRGSTYANDLRKDIKAFTLGGSSSLDTETRDEANLVDLLVRREMKARYQRVRVSLLVSLKATPGSTILEEELLPEDLSEGPDRLQDGIHPGLQRGPRSS